MKRIFTIFFITAMTGISACAQDAARPSPAAKATGKAGSATITIDYSQPSVKGRKIFGDLVPYGKVWRTGANEATVFEVSKNVRVQGKDLPAGKYGLFTIANEGEWTIIFNKTWNQWGAYEYKAADDVLRVSAKAKKSSKFAEKMTFTIAKDGLVTLWWGDHQVEFQVD